MKDDHWALNHHTLREDPFFQFEQCWIGLLEVLREHKGNGNWPARLCLFRTLMPEHHPHMRCSFYPFKWTVVCTVAGFCFQALTAWISWIGALSKLYQVCWEAEYEFTERALMAARQDDNIWEGQQFQFVKCTIWPFERKWKKKIAACKTRYAQTSFLRAWWFTTTPKRPARKHQLVALQNLIPAHYLKLQTLAKGPPKMTMSTNSQVDKPGCVPLDLSSNHFFFKWDIFLNNPSGCNCNVTLEGRWKFVLVKFA